jgi:hypothetical protein
MSWGIVGLTVVMGLLIIGLVIHAAPYYRRGERPEWKPVHWVMLAAILVGFVFIGIMAFSQG